MDGSRTDGAGAPSAKAWDVSAQRHLSFWHILVLFATVPTFLASSLILWWMLSLRDATHEAHLDRLGRNATESVAAIAQHLMADSDTAPLSRSLVLFLAANPDVRGVDVYRADGTLYYAAGRRRQGVTEKVFRAPVQNAPFGVEEGGEGKRRSGAQLVLVRIGFVEVFLEPQARPSAGEEGTSAVVAVVLSTFLAGLVAFVLAGHITARVESLRDWSRSLRSSLSVKGRRGSGMSSDVLSGFERLPALPESVGMAEMAGLGAELGRLRQALIAFANDLDGRVDEKTAELVAVNDALLASNAERRSLVNRSNMLLEEERYRLAIEIHDQTNVSAVAIRLTAQALADLAPRIEDDRLANRVSEFAGSILRATDDLYHSARRIVKQLRPESIDAHGLGAAIDDWVGSVNELDEDCHFEFEDHEDLAGIRGAVALTAFRIIQEATSNIQKHAGADFVLISANIEAIDPAFFDGLGESSSALGPPSDGVERKMLHIQVIDNGQGFAATQGKTGQLGLVGMRERAEAVGGRLTIVSAIGEGCAIHVRIPLSAEG